MTFISKISTMLTDKLKPIAIPRQPRAERTVLNDIRQHITSTAAYLLPNAFMQGHDTGSSAFSCVKSSMGRERAGVPDKRTALTLCLSRSIAPLVRAALAFFK